MECVWADRDGQIWHVHAYNTGGGMASGGGIPDPGKDIARFQDPNKPDNYFVVETRQLRDPDDMTDEVLQELLDQAKLAEEPEAT